MFATKHGLLIKTLLGSAHVRSCFCRPDLTEGAFVSLRGSADLGACLRRLDASFQSSTYGSIPFRRTDASSVGGADLRAVLCGRDEALVSWSLASLSRPAHLCARREGMLVTQHAASDRAGVVTSARRYCSQFVHPVLLTSEQLGLVSNRLDHSEVESLLPALQPSPLQTDVVMLVVSEEPAVVPPTVNHIDSGAHIHALGSDVGDRVDTADFHSVVIA